MAPWHGRDLLRQMKLEINGIRLPQLDRRLRSEIHAFIKRMHEIVREDMEV
ncbi:MAG: hypothetical protein PWP65_1370 [Clostridia bacterium]|nr:hypothetical protein [Clostridia bacterium]